jgi:hypothetical protein
MLAHGDVLSLILNAANIGATGGGLFAALSALRRIRGIKPRRHRRLLAKHQEAPGPWPRRLSCTVSERQSQQQQQPRAGFDSKRRRLE